MPVKLLIKNQPSYKNENAGKLDWTLGHVVAAVHEDYPLGLRERGSPDGEFVTFTVTDKTAADVAVLLDGDDGIAVRNYILSKEGVEYIRKAGGHASGDYSIIQSYVTRVN